MGGFLRYYTETARNKNMPIEALIPDTPIPKITEDGNKVRFTIMTGDEMSHLTMKKAKLVAFSAFPLRIGRNYSPQNM